MAGIRSARRKWWVWGLVAGSAASLLAGWAAINMRPSLEMWPELPTARQGGMEVRFFGTASLAVIDEAEAFVIDGFVSRPRLGPVLLTRLASDERALRQTFSQAGINKVSAVLATHSHYDHAMDAPAIVRLYGGEVWGGASTGRIARADGDVPFRQIAAADVLKVGAMTVRIFETDHAPDGLMMGDVAEDFTVPAKAGDYRFGNGYGLHITHGECRIMVMPSAGLPHQDLSHYPADVIFLSFGQLGLQDKDYIRRYYAATVGASGVRLVVPIHWDDFTRPLEKPLKPLPYAVDRIDIALTEISVLARGEVSVALPLVNAPLDLSVSGRC